MSDKSVEGPSLPIRGNVERNRPDITASADPQAQDSLLMQQYAESISRFVSLSRVVFRNNVVPALPADPIPNTSWQLFEGPSKSVLDEAWPGCAKMRDPKDPGSKDTDELYRQVPLDPAKSEIRVLELLPRLAGQPSQIECNLRVHDFSVSAEGKPEAGGGEYEALSYCWRNAVDNKEGNKTREFWIFVNGKKIPVGGNLRDALFALRQDTPRILWVDAICIDQKNELEKQPQLGLMWKIYSTAQRVIVFLGNEDVHSTRILNFSVATQEAYESLSGDESTGPHFYRTAAGLGDVDVEIFASLHYFLTRTWFTRVWVVQEYALARQEPVIYCGSKSIGANTLLSGLRQIMDVIPSARDKLAGRDAAKLHRLLPERIYKDTIVAAVGSMRLAIDNRIMIRNVFETAAMLHARGCEQPQDRVYGYHSFYNPLAQHVFHPTRKPLNEEMFFPKLLVWLLVMERFMNVYAFLPLLRDPAQPTWMTDFATSFHYADVWPFLGLPTPRPRSQSCVINGKVLAVEGYEIDRIREVVQLDSLKDLVVFERLWLFHQRANAAVEARKAAGSPESSLHDTGSLRAWAFGVPGNFSLASLILPLEIFEAELRRLLSIIEADKKLKKHPVPGLDLYPTWATDWDDIYRQAAVVPSGLYQEHTEIFIGGILFDFDGFFSTFQNVFGHVQLQGLVAHYDYLVPEYERLARLLAESYENYTDRLPNVLHVVRLFALRLRHLIRGDPVTDDDKQWLRNSVMGYTLLQFIGEDSLKLPDLDFAAGTSMFERSVLRSLMALEEAGQAAERVAKQAEKVQKSGEPDKESLAAYARMSRRRLELIERFKQSEEALKLVEEKRSELEEHQRILTSGNLSRDEIGRQFLTPRLQGLFCEDHECIDVDKINSLELFRKHKFFLTENGFAGTGIGSSAGFEVGDTVCILDGLSAPMVVRESKNSETHGDTVSFVGPAIVRGLMAEGIYESLGGREFARSFQKRWFKVE